jgi:hypothetical protein
LIIISFDYLATTSTSELPRFSTKTFPGNLFSTINDLFQLPLQRQQQRQRQQPQQQRLQQPVKISNQTFRSNRALPKGKYIAISCKQVVQYFKSDSSDVSYISDEKVFEYMGVQILHLTTRS